MESQDFDKLFREAFEQAEETPSNRVWEGIDQELKKEKKVIPFYIKYRTQLSIAAMFLLFFGVGLTFYKKPVLTGKEKIEDILTSIEAPKTPSKESENNSAFENSKKSAVEVENTMTAQVITNNNTITEPTKTSTEYQDEKYSHQEIEERVELYAQEIAVASIEADVEIAKAHYEEVGVLSPLKDDREGSYVFTERKEETKSSLVTRVLNGISKNIISKNLDGQDNKEIEFKNDEEGSLSINIINSFARK